MESMPSVIFLSLFLIALNLSVSMLWAGVVRLQVDSRHQILEGRSFGLAGPYEKLAGRVYFEVDPTNRADRIITDIDQVSRNERGQVDFSADFYLLKPMKLERSNKALLLEVCNRGRKSMLSFFNHASGSLDPSSEMDFGDGFLLREGYLLLWVGWQFDPPWREDLMRLYAPVANGGGRPIRGLVRSDFVVQQRVDHHLLADRNHLAYPVADPEAVQNVMTLREGVEDVRRTVLRSRWKFARVEGQNIVNDPRHVYLESGFEPGKIYEVVYLAENPPLVGLGPAAVRDLVALLKREGSNVLGIPGGSINRAIGFGISQSGRFLRTFLYYGFNEDEAHCRVFDGVVAHVVGAGRGSFNHRFAQPSRDAHPFMNFFYPTDIFPFTDVEQFDPETALSDGLLTHHSESPFLPKVFYTNSSYEYWGRAASLIHTSVEGLRDAPLMDNVRIYLFSGTQHGPAGFPPIRTIGQQMSNPLDFLWSMRALLKAMDRWVADDVPPPPSCYPRLDDGTLVRAENLSFPNIPGVQFSARFHRAYRVDYGLHFRSRGVITLEPPQVGNPFPVMVPVVDNDGNEMAGIRLPELMVPLATYTGWNLFNVDSGPTHEISSMVGSYIPFPRTKEERKIRKDPRRSIEERYQSVDNYLGRLSKVTLDLIDQGYLLAEDMPEILRHARRHWDYLAKVKTSQ